MSREPATAIVKYRRIASRYDHMVRFRRARFEAVAALAPAEGETVLEVACGTGLNLPELARRVGATGRVIGVDLSPAMLAEARIRCSRELLRNVVLIESSAEELALGEPADALLLSFAHDVTQSHAALRNVLAQLQTEARVVAVGSRWDPPPPLRPMTPLLRLAARTYVTNVSGYEQPWRPLAEQLGDVSLSLSHGGTCYRASGTRSRSLAEEPPDCLPVA